MLWLQRVAIITAAAADISGACSRFNLDLIMVIGYNMPITIYINIVVTLEQLAVGYHVMLSAFTFVCV